MDYFEVVSGLLKLRSTGGTLNEIRFGTFLDPPAWIPVIRRRGHHEQEQRDQHSRSDVQAIDTLEAQHLPPGPERAKALNKATTLRNAAEVYNYLFSNEL